MSSIVEGSRSVSPERHPRLREAFISSRTITRIPSSSIVFQYASTLPPPADISPVLPTVVTCMACASDPHFFVAGCKMDKFVTRKSTSEIAVDALVDNLKSFAATLPQNRSRSASHKVTAMGTMGPTVARGCSVTLPSQKYGRLQASIRKCLPFSQYPSRWGRPLCFAGPSEPIWVPSKDPGIIRSLLRSNSVFEASRFLEVAKFSPRRIYPRPICPLANPPPPRCSQITITILECFFWMFLRFSWGFPCPGFAWFCVWFGRVFPLQPAWFWFSLGKQRCFGIGNGEGLDGLPQQLVGDSDSQYRLTQLWGGAPL